jgi:hypothetical protein
LQLPDSEEKVRASKQFDKYMQERQELLELGGGKLPFLELPE